MIAKQGKNKTKKIGDNEMTRKTNTKENNMVKCINCKALDIGFNQETDAWVHCSIKHARDIRDRNYRKQPKITEAIAQIEIKCKDFIRADNKSDIFELAREMDML